MSKVGKLIKLAGRRTKLFGKRNKVGICMVVGGVLAGATVVTSCVQTYRGLDDILQDHADRMEKVHELKEKAKDLPDDDPLKKEIAKDTLRVYAVTVYKCARLYALPLTLAGTSAFVLATAHKEMKKIRKGLVGALVAERKVFQAYRKRTAERIGEEAEEEIYFGTSSRELGEIETDADGNETVVQKMHDNVLDTGIEGSPFVKYFVKGNPNWSNSPSYCATFLTIAQSRLNDILRREGELTLNSAYDLLGFTRTEEGMVFGWLFDKEQPFGENKVELTIKQVKVPNENGVGYSLGYAVGFNVDGNIYEEKCRRKGLSLFRKRKSDSRRV